MDLGHLEGEPRPYLGDILAITMVMNHTYVRHGMILQAVQVTDQTTS